MAEGRLPRARWFVALVGFVFIVVIVFVVPRVIYPPLRSHQLDVLGLKGKSRLDARYDRFKLQNELRTSLVQGLAGLAVLTGGYVAYRQLQTGREQLQHTIQASKEQHALDERGQVTERFGRAIDQLGHAVLDVRLGGIYALERIANDSPDDGATIAEVLTAFVRGHAAWTEPADDSVQSPAALIDELPDLRVRAADVQAVMSVLGRRALPPAKAKPLLLTRVDLRKADLDGANLQGVNLSGANLEGTPLGGAHLQGADLSYAHLKGTNPQDANLEGAHATRATLWPNGFDPEAAGVRVTR